MIVSKYKQIASSDIDEKYKRTIQRVIINFFSEYLINGNEYNLIKEIDKLKDQQLPIDYERNKFEEFYLLRLIYCQIKMEIETHQLILEKKSGLKTLIDSIERELNERFKTLYDKLWEIKLELVSKEKSLPISSQLIFEIFGIPCLFPYRHFKMYENQSPNILNENTESVNIFLSEIEMFGWIDMEFKPDMFNKFLEDKKLYKIYFMNLPPPKPNSSKPEAFKLTITLKSNTFSTLFIELTRKGFLDEKLNEVSDLEHTFTEKIPKRKLDWRTNYHDLSCFIKYLIKSDTIHTKGIYYNKHWIYTANCFTVLGEEIKLSTINSQMNEPENRELRMIVNLIKKV